MRLPQKIFTFQRKTHFVIFTDGAIRPHVCSGLGAVVRDSAQHILHLWHQPAGPMTNNEAKYEAACMALKNLAKHVPRLVHRQVEVDLYTDSQVLVEQMRGTALTNAPGLRMAQSRLRKLVFQFARVTFHHIPREENRLADALALAQRLRARGDGWVVDGDIEACFDSLDHDLLIKRLHGKIQDGRVIRMIQNWLDTGVLKAGLPLETEDSFTDWLKSAPKTVQLGLDWALASATAQEDPYAAARYEEALRGMEEEAPPETGEDALHHIRRAALRRVAINGLILGASWGRDLARMVGNKLSETFRTPQGRRLLKRGAMATGGLAGAAAVAALTAYALQRKAGPAPTGVLQGAPLSPLLTNVYLHPFDIRMSKLRHHLIRFADDWVILVPDRERADQAYNEAFEGLARLKLRLNREKTHIHPPDTAFEWLGAVIK